MAGFGIGLVAVIMGVAGGELLITTIVLLFGEDRVIDIARAAVTFKPCRGRPGDREVGQAEAALARRAPMAASTVGSTR